MNKKSNGQIKTKQVIKNNLFSKHPDLFIQEFIDKSLNGDENAINVSNTYYFANNVAMFQELKKDIDELLCETIGTIFNSIGYEKDKDYKITPDYKIKTTPVVFVKTLCAYDYDVEMANILKNVLIY
jgi:hypothetical protein